MSDALYNEIDPFAAEWLERLIERGLIATGRVDTRSIADLTAADVTGRGQRHFFAGIGGWSAALRLADVADDADVWTGSCPCQPFSDAGTRSGTRDARHLWPAWFALIEQCRPAVVFGEQVASRAGLAWLDVVCADLERCGYAVGSADLCAASVGAPHIRQRLYFVAYAGERGRALVRAARLRDHGQSRNDAARCGSPLLVGDAAGVISGSRRDAGAHGRTAIATDRPSATRRVGDSDRARLAWTVAGEERAGIGAAGSTGEARELGDAGGDGTVEHVGELPRDEAEHALRVAHSYHSPVDPSATRGYWRDAEWIPCIDGVARPVEPGAFPLAHGVPARVGRLRGYGNAIVAPLAATFIEAAFDAIGDMT